MLCVRRGHNEQDTAIHEKAKKNRGYWLAHGKELGAPRSEVRAREKKRKKGLFWFGTFHNPYRIDTIPDTHIFFQPLVVKSGYGETVKRFRW